jgi:hypothetical protein
MLKVSTKSIKLKYKITVSSFLLLAILHVFKIFIKKLNVYSRVVAYSA